MTPYSQDDDVGLRLDEGDLDALFDEVDGAFDAWEQQSVEAHDRQIVLAVGEVHQVTLRRGDRGGPALRRSASVIEALGGGGAGD